MALPQHSGSVYAHKAKNQWKETWLSLEASGKLTWKKKDAYEVKGVAYVDEILDHIQISGWTAKKCAQNNDATPFLIRLPIIVHGSKSNKTLTVKTGADLDLWLDAFATVVGKWKLWRACKRKQAFRISRQKSLDERSVEQQLKYEELVEFYRSTWSEFLASCKKRDLEAEDGLENSSIQNSTTQQIGAKEELLNSDHNSEIAKQLYVPNGLPRQDQVASPSSHDYAEIAPAQQQTTQVVVTTTTVTVHQPVDQPNGAAGKQNQNGDIYGEEDDGEEMRF